MNRILVHADGGRCHGTPLEKGWCPHCGYSPDMQSTELWTPEAVAKRDIERAIEFVEENGYADPGQCRLLVARIRELEKRYEFDVDGGEHDDSCMARIGKRGGYWDCDCGAWK